MGPGARGEEGAIIILQAHASIDSLTRPASRRARRATVSSTGRRPVLGTRAREARSATDGQTTSTPAWRTKKRTRPKRASDPRARVLNGSGRGIRLGRTRVSVGCCPRKGGWHADRLLHARTPDRVLIEKWPGYFLMIRKEACILYRKLFLSEEKDGACQGGPSSEVMMSSTSWSATANSHPSRRPDGPLSGTHLLA